VSDPLGLDSCEIAEEVVAGRLGAREVVEAFAPALEGEDLNAVITLTLEEALARADEGVRGLLAGVPLLVKDLFDTAGVRTTYGSSIYRDHVPERTAVAVARLEEAGALVLGKANLHEFAWGVTSQNPHYGTVGNPVRPGCVAGGSSGGNAAALAAGLCALALGSDTGGSVRIPAACCDVVGYKPRVDRIPGDGCFPLSRSFDAIGPMARTVRDCVLANAVLTGAEVPAASAQDVRVGVLGEVPEAERLEALGARLVPAELPAPEADIAPLFLLECAVSHRGLFPERREEYGPDTTQKWDMARRVPAIDVYEAQRELPRWRERAREVPPVDLVVSPTLGIEVPPDDCWELDVRGGLTLHTRPWNLLDWPAIAIGGLQIAGRDEATVLGAALAWEEAYGPPGRTA
jgi:Asp-tRNA(Asn)/Glu-tRNA(Gln) amidotransferase A subunit family amidase